MNPDVLVLRAIISVVAVVAVLASVLLAFTNWKYAGHLSEAREAARQAAIAAVKAEGRAEQALLAALVDSARADSAAKVAQEHAARARALKAQLATAVRPASTSIPDTCAAYIANALDERDIERQAGEQWMLAFEAQFDASVALQAEIDTLKPALADLRSANAELRAKTTTLIDTSRRSFWDKLVPKVGVGAAAGLAAGGGVDAVVGLTLSWPL